MADCRQPRRQAAGFPEERQQGWNHRALALGGKGTPDMAAIARAARAERLSGLSTGATGSGFGFSATTGFPGFCVRCILPF